jgi:hypothetical protein
MSASARNRGAVPLAKLASRVLGPVTAKRGFAKADLLAAWDEVAGQRYAAVTQPEKLHWPRDGAGAVLTVRVAGPAAVFLQHETEQFIARVNSFLGYNAVTDLRIVQRPLSRDAAVAAEPPPTLSAEEEQAVQRAVGEIDSDDLRDALTRLGEAIAAENLARA